MIFGPLMGQPIFMADDANIDLFQGDYMALHSSNTSPLRPSCFLPIPKVPERGTHSTLRAS